MKGMTACKVCGRDFPLMSEEHYVARGIMETGVIPAIKGQEEATQYDAFDCPHCGCQNVMQERKNPSCPCDFGICDECCTEEEEPTEHDGCKGCKHVECDTDEPPCCKCKSAYMDMYEKGEEDE